MAIPDDRVLCPMTPAELEEEIEEIAEAGAPDPWLRHLRAMIHRRAPGDEICKYYATEYAAPELDPWQADFYKGFALVRDDEILDWIQVPPGIS